MHARQPLVDQRVRCRQNCGNSLGSRPSVRISDIYLRDNSGSALKALIEADESALEGSQIRTRARSMEAMQPTTHTMPMRQINLFPSTERIPFDTYDTYEYARSSSPPQGEHLGIPMSTERMTQSHTSGRWTPDGFDGFEACVGNARSAPAACWSDLPPPSHDNNRDRCITPPDAAHTRAEHPWSRVTDCYEVSPHHPRPHHPRGQVKASLSCSLSCRTRNAQTLAPLHRAVAKLCLDVV